MSLPAGFPDFRSVPAQRRPVPDYTRRGTKVRLFAAAAAVMLVLFLIERGPRLFSLVRGDGRGEGHQPAEAVGESPRVAVGERSSTTAAVGQASTPSLTPHSRPPTPSLPAILEGYSLGRAELARFTDGEPLTPAEVELLARILDVLPRLRFDVWRARQSMSAVHSVVSAPAEHRGEVIAIRGRARHVAKESLPSDLAERFEFQDYYRVLVDLDDFNEMVALYARRVPAAWPLDEALDEAIDEPVEADALFLKALDTGEDAPRLAFAVDRVAWLPQKVDAARGVDWAHVELAKLGMDIGLWDDVRRSNQRPLEASDREAFYQLLAAVGQPQAAAVLSVSGDWLAIGELLQRPEKFQGSVQRIEGVARRIRRIEVPDADVRERFGFDHYYEIDLFVPLGDANVRLGEAQPGKPAPEFRNTFPTTLVVRELPPGLAPRDNLHEQISASAVFFKIWTYDSRYTARYGQLQPAPLFVAFQPQLIESDVPSSWFSTTLVSTALGLSLALLMLILWWSARPSRRITPSTTPPPDFTHLR